MELEDLKERWKENKFEKRTNKKIMDIIRSKDYGPVAALKSSYRKQMVLMGIMPLILIATNINDIEKVLSNVMFWSYVIFCIGVIFFASHNYRIAEKMLGMDGMVSSNLEQQINLLEKRMNWKIKGLRVAMLFFIILTELLPYFQHYRMLDRWHSLHVPVRFAVYGALLVLQYFLLPKVLQRKFGRHLSYLKELSRELKQ